MEFANKGGVFMINQDNFAKNLVAIMKSRGITTTRLSAEIDIPEITINKLRNGQNKNPTINTLLPIIQYFNISLDDLFKDNNSKIKLNIPVITMDGSKRDMDVFNLDEYFTVVDFLIEVTCDSYSDFTKGSLLLLSKKEALNGDFVIVKLNDCLMPCKLVIECGVLTCKSLIYLDKYYQINVDNILGVIMGTIWKRN